MEILWHYLRQIEATTSRLEKEDLLRRAVADPRVGELIKLYFKACFDPYTNHNMTVRQSDIDLYGTVVTTGTSSVDKILLQRFIKFIQKGSRKKSDQEQVLRTLALCDTESRDWLSRVVNKKPKVGVQVSTINKLWPGLVPVFGAALAGTLDPDKHIITRDNPRMGDGKIDGIRAFVFGPSQNTPEVVVLSRNGKPLNNWAEPVQRLFEVGVLRDWVFDVEFRHPEGRDMTWSILSSGTAHVKQQTLQVYLLDAMTSSEWFEQNCMFTQLQRRDVVEGVCALVDDPLVLVPPCEMVTSMDEALRLMERYHDEGIEGAVFKNPNALYSYDRTDDWIKAKPFYDADLEVLGVELGWMDPDKGTIEEEQKPGHVQAVRRLVCDYNGVDVYVGSGLKREERIRFVSDWPDIVEVRYQSVTKDGSLEFPTLQEDQRFRAVE